MSYLGRSAKLSLKAQEKVSFLATAGQTSKTGLSYTVGFIEVYVNGVLLTDTTDFTATNGNSITFTVALLLNDEVTVISLKTFSVADHYNKTEADTLLAAKATIANFTSTGIDDNATSTAVTIDASENVLVGKTSGGTGTQGVELNPTSAAGYALAATSSGQRTALFNRLSSDGEIISLRKDGTTVGSIGTQNGSDFFITGSASIATGLRFQANEIVPVNGSAGNVDAAIDIGKSNIRFKDAYLSGGVYLGGTGAANKLDDYEEGTATISYTPASGSITMFYNTARYVKIGQLVFMEFSLSCNGASSPSGTVKLTGLPFTANGTGGLGVAGTGGAFGGYQFPTDQTNVTVYNGSTEAYVTDATSNYLQASEMGFGYNAGQGGFSFTYRTNS